MPTNYALRRSLADARARSGVLLLVLSLAACKTVSLKSISSSLGSSSHATLGSSAEAGVPIMIGHDPLVSHASDIQQEDLREHIAKLTEVLKKSPRDVEVLIALARLKVIAGDAKGAEPLARKVLAIDFRNRPAKIVMANVELLRKNQEAERAVLRQLGGENATESESLNMLACLTWADGDEDKTEKILLRAVKISPEDSAARMNLGLVYLRQEKLTVAEEHFNQVLKHFPDHADALTHLGVVYAMQGKTQKSIEAYEHARRENPSSELAAYNLALAQKRSGLYQSAIRTLKEALALKNLSLAGHDAATAQLQQIKMTLTAKSNISNADLDNILANAKQQRGKRTGAGSSDVYLISNVGSYR